MSAQQVGIETVSGESLNPSGYSATEIVMESETDQRSVPGKLEILAQTVQKLVAEAPARKRLRQRLATLCITAMGTTVGAGLLGAFTDISGFAALGQVSAMATLGITAVTVFAIQRQLWDPRLKQITALDDVRAIAPMLDLMENSQEMWEYDDSSRLAIKAALVRLLPQLKASDVDWLTEGQRAALVRTLYYCTHRKYPWHYHPDLAVALLAALEQVGSGDALEYVQELADMSASNARQERIREAARSCVPYLQIRAREQNAMETLLRASQESADPKQLLRPHGPDAMKRRPDSGVNEQAEFQERPV